MKRWLRRPAVQALLGWLIAAYIELVIATLRWRRENEAPARVALDGSEGLIALFWHGRIVPAIACRPILKDKPRTVMISLSPDGEFIALAAERLRIPTIRGSTGRGGKSGTGGGGKGGVGAFRQAMQVLASGGVMIMTPDGPRGPNEVMQLGPVQMARASGRPAFLMGLAVRPAIPLGSWDRGRVPLPFGRAALVLEGPLGVAANADDAALEAVRDDWQARLRAAQARAEALLEA
ncbi:MAG: hypothetical protein JWO83_1534 [Caulobacteraceae bacterium]|nr:hypothetical protein [Caulobacteraceae bacterium]